MDHDGGGRVDVQIFFFFSNKQSTLISPASILSCIASRRNKCESL